MAAETGSLTEFPYRLAANDHVTTGSLLRLPGVPITIIRDVTLL